MVTGDVKSRVVCVIDMCYVKDSFLITIAISPHNILTVVTKVPNDMHTIPSLLRHLTSTSQQGCASQTLPGHSTLFCAKALIGVLWSSKLHHLGFPYAQQDLTH